MSLKGKNEAFNLKNFENNLRGRILKKVKNMFKMGKWGWNIFFYYKIIILIGKLIKNV